MGGWRVYLSGLLGTAYRLRPGLLRLFLSLFRTLARGMTLLIRMIALDTCYHALVSGLWLLLVVRMVLDC